MSSRNNKQPFNQFYGHLSWANLFDWLITFCVAALLMATTAFLGGVRPDTIYLILPLFSVVIVLHGIWLAVNKDLPLRVSHVPLLFLPFLVWMYVSARWITPTGWLGEMEVVIALLVFVLLWILSNNLQMWSQASVLFVCILAPVGYGIFNGFYQFFQNPERMVKPMAGLDVVLDPTFYGKATGVFADPSSFAVLLLIILIACVVIGSVPRFAFMIRMFCYYTAAMIIISLMFTQRLWAVIVLVPLCFAGAWLTNRQGFSRFWKGGLVALVLVLLCGAAAVLHPRVGNSYQHALTPDGEMVRWTLWKDAIRIFKESPMTGVGAGSFNAAFESSPVHALSTSPQTPHNDYLLLLSEYGLIGGVLFLGPLLWVFGGCYKEWASMPFKVTSENLTGKFMPRAKISLGMSMGAVFVSLLCAVFNFMFYVPALAFIAVSFYAQMVKSGMRRRVHLSDKPAFRLGYLAASVLCAFWLFGYVSPRVESYALELQASGRLDDVVKQRAHVSGNEALLSEVITDFEESLSLNPKNVDALIGLSASYCQLYYRDPSKSFEVGQVASRYAETALELSDGYWKAWAQYGVALALSGQLEEAEAALGQALEIAPNNSDANYYWASFLSSFPDRQAVALEAINQALAINPNHEPARRLQQKLLIL